MTILEVRLWDSLVGNLFYDLNQAQAFFRYDRDFLNGSLDISTLLMPLNGNTNIYSFPTLPQETFKGLPPVFSDSLPDKFGNEILNTWLQKQGRLITDLNPLERLSYIGMRGMGALEYMPPQAALPPFSGKIVISDIVAIAKEVLNAKKNQVASLSSMDGILHIGTSAGGARAKAIIAIDPKTQEVFSGDILHANKEIKYQILKIDGVKDIENRQSDGYGRIEYAYYRMAKESGIEMTESTLFEENGRAHFMTERFDRSEGHKIHMTTLNSMANMDYNQPLAHSYEQCYGVMGKLDLSHQDLKKQFRRMVFNVLARNQDDHTKNISFLMDRDGSWKLSPAYDVTYAYDPTNRWLKQHQMSINGKRSGILLADLNQAASSLDPRTKQLIIEQVIEGVSKWKEIANQVGIPKNRIKEIETNLLYNQVNSQKRVRTANTVPELSNNLIVDLAVKFHKENDYEGKIPNITAYYPNSALLRAIKVKFGIVLTESQLTQVHKKVKQARNRNRGLSI